MDNYDYISFCVKFIFSFSYFLSRINLNMHESIHGTIGQTTNMVEKSHIMMLITHINLHMDIGVLLE